MRAYRTYREEVPEDYYTVELGKAAVVQEGRDVTVISWGSLVRETLSVIRKLESEQGWKIELIDLRTLSPWDEETVYASVNKTGRAVIVHEAVLQSGFGAELAASIYEACILQLEAPVLRVAGFDVPPPLFQLEDLHGPTEARIELAIARVIAF
jgi:2-oxoisovalerate dehydrogenase E1 component beta subunit